MSSCGKVNWVSLIDDVGVCAVRKFVSGEMSGKEFSQRSPEARRVVSTLKVDNARSRGRHALYRYNQRTAVMT